MFQAIAFALATPMAFATSGWKRALSIAIVLASIVTTKVHATIKIKDLKEVAAPTFTVDGKVSNVAEATQALLDGKRAFKCTEVELVASKTGISIKPKKGN